MSFPTRSNRSHRCFALIATLGLFGAVACQPASPAPVAPTAAPPKPTTAAAVPAASPVSSPSPAASPAASAPAKPAVPSPSPFASPAASPAASPSAAIRTVTIDAGDFSFSAPDTIQAGLVSLVMRNTGQEPHHAQLAKLNAGVTLDQFMAALRQGEGPALALVTLTGGPGAILPNASSESTVELQEGQYVMLCFIASPDGVPHLAKGMVLPFRVTAPAIPAAAPAARETLTMKDFSFEMPDVLPAGRNTYRIVSAGPSQPHELQFSRLQAGKTAQDVSAHWAAPPAGPPPYTPLGGLQGLIPNAVGWVTVDLQPGDYAAICVIPDPTSGKRHIDLGMIKAFTVR